MPKGTKYNKISGFYNWGKQGLENTWDVILTFQNFNALLIAFESFVFTS